MWIRDGGTARTVLVNGDGGGGIGDPLQRDPARVLDDVVSQSISPKAAHDVYGVVIKDGMVDAEETVGLRRSIGLSRQRAGASA